MKNLLQLLLALTFVLFISCKKDDEESKQEVKKETISAKWEVKESSEFASFEFNESGNYIIEKNLTKKSTNSSIVLFGTYKIINSTTIELSDFGTIIISSLTDNSISFTIKLKNSTSEIAINASKTEEVASSSKTDLLCKTWELVSITGEGSEYLTDMSDFSLTVLFSKAGTYFVKTSQSGFDNSMVAHWAWKDSNEKVICYSWSGSAPTCNGSNEVTINVLTSTSLKITEGTIVYDLKPYVEPQDSTISYKVANGISLNSKFLGH